MVAMLMPADRKNTKNGCDDDAGRCGVSVAEVLGGVDINWSPPITDWSHHYGNDDRDDDGDGDDDDGDNDCDDGDDDDDDNECDDDHDNIKCC